MELKKLTIEFDEAEMHALITTGELLHQMSISGKFSEWKRSLTLYDRRRYTVAMDRMALLVFKLQKALKDVK